MHKIGRASTTVGSLRHKAISATKWSFASQLSRQLMNLATTTLLARLLPPSDFGLLGMALVVNSAVDLFRDLGLSSTVIQKKGITETCLSSIFWLSAWLGTALTGF